MRKLACAMALSLVLAASACGTDGPGEERLSPSGASSLLLPAATATDLVSYGDHVLVVTVTTDREMPLSPEEARRGEGLILREVTLRVDKALWTRPGAQPAPETITSTASGWTVHEGNKRKRLTTQGFPRLEMGNTYLVAVYRAQERGYAPDDWMPFLIFPYNDGEIGRGDQSGGRPAWLTGELAAAHGKPGAWLADLLRTTAADPISAKYQHLDGAARFRAVAAERGVPAVP